MAEKDGGVPIHDVSFEIFTVHQGRTSAIYKFASLLDRGLLLKETICSLRSKFFPLSIVPFLEGISSRKANKNTQKLFPFVELAGIMKVSHTPLSY